jgi:hypothetical protein
MRRQRIGTAQQTARCRPSQDKRRSTALQQHSAVSAWGLGHRHLPEPLSGCWAARSEGCRAPTKRYECRATLWLAKPLDHLTRKRGCGRASKRTTRPAAARPAPLAAARRREHERKSPARPAHCARREPGKFRAYCRHGSGEGETPATAIRAAPRYTARIPLSKQATRFELPAKYSYCAFPRGFGAELQCNSANTRRHENIRPRRIAGMRMRTT